MEVSAIILAGGLGTRMGGADKGLVAYQNQRLIDHVLQRIQPQVDQIIINANRNLATYQALGYPVITDQNTDYNGPLAGIQAGLHYSKTTNAQTPYIVTAPCDSPHLPLDLVSRLLKALSQADADIAIAKTASGTHPVFCLCKTSLKQSLDDFLNSGQRKVSTWQTQCKHVYVEFEDEQAFTNINALA